MGTKAFLLDADKCTSCKMCVIACKDEHVDASYAPWTGPQPDMGHFWVDIKTIERGRTPRVKMHYMPLFCQHCEDAPCISACPEDAIETRPDGLVWIDETACTGCGECQPACPYDVIFMNGETHVAQKCTGCAHRVDEGLLPRCADVCPHEAILFGDADDPMFSNDPAQKPLEDYLPEAGAKPRAKWRGLLKPFITGNVVDTARDEGIEGATVVATANGKSVETQSDAFGDFWLRDLPAGQTWSVTVKAEGYGTVEQRVPTNGDQDLGTISLKVGS